MFVIECLAFTALIMTDQIDTFRANLYDQKQQRLFTDVILVAAMDGTKCEKHKRVKGK